MADFPLLSPRMNSGSRSSSVTPWRTGEGGEGWEGLEGWNAGVGDSEVRKASHACYIIDVLRLSEALCFVNGWLATISAGTDLPVVDWTNCSLPCAGLFLPPPEPLFLLPEAPVLLIEVLFTPAEILVLRLRIAPSCVPVVGPVALLRSRCGDLIGGAWGG
jgi:hypothetical protein